MKPGRHRLQSVILGRVNYSEADLIIKFFSEEKGKISGLAKHGRKSRQRFGNVLSPGDLVDLEFTHKAGRDLVRLESGDLVRSFENIGSDVRRLALCGQALELTDAFCAPHDPAPDIFQLLIWCLERFDENNRPDEALFIFLVRLLNLAGFGPNFGTCCHCGRSHDDLPGCEADIEQGGIICRQCKPGNGSISLGTLKILCLVQGMDKDKLDRVRINDRVRLETQIFLINYVRHVLGRDLKTLRFMDQIDKMNSRV